MFHSPCCVVSCSGRLVLWLPAAALAADSLVAAAVAKIIFLLASHVFTALFAHCSTSAGSNCFWLPAASCQRPAAGKQQEESFFSCGSGFF